MHDRTVVPGPQLGGEVAGAAAQQRRQFVGVVVHQPAGNNEPSGPTSSTGSPEENCPRTAVMPAGSSDALR